MKLVDQQFLWAKVQEAWTKPHARKTIARLLGMTHDGRYEQVHLSGLDRPQKREAWFASLAQMRARNQGKGE